MKRATLAPAQFVAHDGRPVMIREATLPDAPALLAYAQSYFNESDIYTPIAPGEFALGIDGERGFISNHVKENGILLLAYSGAEIIGCLNVTGGTTSRNRHVGTLGVSVARAWRALGVGGQLMQTAIDWARLHPTIERLELEVFSANVKAMQLYRRLGFEEEGRRRRAYIWNGQPLDAVVMAMLFEN